MHIWQKGSHENAVNTKALYWSRYLHNDVSSALHRLGAKPTQILRGLQFYLLSLFVKYLDHWRHVTGLLSRYTFAHKNTLFMKSTIDIPEEFPEHRRPTLKQIRQMIPAVTRRARLHSDPFTAVHILAERMPRNVYK